jgi:Zn-dependent protease
MTPTNAAAQPKSFLERLRPPEGQSFVWWMIDIQRGTLKQVAAFVLFLLTFRYLFQWSWSLSVAMLLSMFLHECGHAAVFWLAKIRFIILYLFPLGAVAAPVSKEEDARSDLLHWNTIGWLLQAGPAVNVALILLFLVLQRVFQDATLVQFSHDMVYVNGLLGAMNLVPVWTLDAGQLFKVIYNSLEEHEDNWLTGVLLGGTGVLLLVVLRIPGMMTWAAVLVNTITRFGWIVFLVIFTIGILNQQGRDNPLHARSHQAMNNRQVMMQLLVYGVQVAVTLWVFAGPLA